MELNCPSCGLTHNTDEHAGAFDIECPCGYRILMPDLDSPNEESEEELGEEPLELIDQTLETAPPVLDVVVEEPISEELAPQTNKDSELLYDPFDLEQERRLIHPTQQDPSAHQFVGDEVVQRMRDSSLGRSLGPCFDLKLELENPTHNKQLLQRCQVFIKSRSWLENHLLEQGLNFNSPDILERLHKIPEVLAIHIYLETLKMQGICHFKESQES